VDTSATDGYRYRSPIVIQRFAGAADPSVPGFYGGAEVWVMEDDGSHLRKVRASGAGHLDHPTLLPDREHVVYSEFADPSTYVAATAALVRENLYTGERSPMRAVEGCAVHHNTISPCDHGLSYMVSGPRGHEQVTEVDGDPLVIHPPEGNKLLLANGVSMPGGVVLQVEAVPRTTPRRISIAVYSHASGTLCTLTRSPAMHRRPALSPCGTRVAWQSNARDPRADDLHIADIDGSNHRILTETGAKDGHAWFSRDGQSLYFESNRTGNWEIHKAGSRVRPRYPANR
jgi:WD40 repeat protein